MSDRAATPWVQESWTAANGLPVNSINHIIQDRVGYIWVTTFDGLVRFDGARFTIYNTSNSPGLETNRLGQIYEGRDGALWIITERRTLVRLRGGRFTTLAQHPESVSVVLEDSAGRVWIGTSQGLGLVRHDSIVAIGRETLTSSWVSSLLARRDGTLWVGTFNGELYRLTREGRLERAPSDSVRRRSAVTILREDSSGVLWIGTPHGFWSDRGGEREGPGARRHRGPARQEQVTTETRSRRLTPGPGPTLGARLLVARLYEN